MPEYPPTFFMDLPDELVLHIVSSFHAIESFDPQAQAFRLKEQEKARQCENNERRTALHALCLTSKRLRRICEPLLYSAFMGSSTWSGLLPLQLFIRTLTEQPALSDHVKYIENRLSDYLGNGLYDDLEFYGAVDMVKEYFDTLAEVIGRTRNLAHLNVVSLETSEVSLWRHLIQDKELPPRMAMHGFPKLQTLCLQIHTEDYGLGEESAWFQRITNALLSVPTLKQIRASGPTSGAVIPFPGKHKSLHTVDISECILDFVEVVQLTAACTRLKNIGVHWAYLNSHGFHMPDLYSALHIHANTLETLRIDTREVRFCADDFPLEPLGNFRMFPQLRSIEICETSLLANTMSILDFPDQRLSIRIAQLLPPSVENFTLLVKSEYGYNDDCRIDESFALWDLTEDCLTMLPNLNEVTIKSSYDLQAINLTASFRDAGVKLRLVREIDVPRYD